MPKLSELNDKLYNGRKHETLFHEPFPKKVTEYDDSFQMLQRILGTGDERAYVVVAAIVSEAYVDRMLALLLPSFTLPEGMAKKKITLLHAFSIIPNHLIQAAELVQEVRNRFAHDLNIASFDEFERSGEKATRLIRKLTTFAGQRDLPSKNGLNVRNLFEDCLMVATSGLNRYLENVRYYAEMIRSPDFIDALAQRHAEEHRRHLDIVVEALRQHQSAPITDMP